MKKLLCIIFTFVMLVCAVTAAPALTGSAAGSTVLGVSNKSPNVGDTVTVTVTFRAGEAMYATEGYVSFNSAVMQFEGGGSANIENGRVKLVGMPGGASSQSFSLTFKMIGAGESTVALSDAKYVGSDEVGISGSSFKLTVNGAATSDPATSSTTSTPAAPAAGTDATLTSLKLSEGTLSPAFNPATLSYKATVDNKTTKVTVTASPASGAKVSGTGTVKLSVGDNKRNLTVTAADGKTKKTYTVTIHRLAEGEAEPAASEPTDTDPAANTDVLAVTVDGKPYHISASLESLPLPAGFNAVTSSYSGNPVPAYEDEKSVYTLFGLTSDEDGTTDFYTYNAADNAFKKLVYAYFSNRFYIFPGMEENTAAPDGFFEKKTEISGILVDCYAYDDAAMTDFYVVYCYSGGKYGYYRYDSIEETMQRFPEFEPEKAELTVNDSKQNEPKGFWGRLTSLSTKAKATLFALVIVAACIIALVVLLILKIIADRREANEGFSDDSAFDYGVDDAVPFDSVEELSDDSDDGENG